MGVAPQSFAQSSAVLKITGTIVPPACTPTFEGGDVIDFGQVSPRDALTKVGEKKTSLRIACTSPSFIAFKVTDNRNGTQVTRGALSTIASWLAPNLANQGGGIMGWNDQLFGLGKTTKGAKIGAYTMQLGTAKVSGSTSGGLGQLTNLAVSTGVSLSDWMPVVGGTADSAYKTIAGMVPGLNASHGLWITRSGMAGAAGTIVTGDTGLYVAKNFKYSAVNAANVLNAGSFIPLVGGGVAHAINGKNFTFPITVRAMLNSASELGTGTSEKLDGQATFDLVYI
ncbi:glutamyl-tRNA amidotransferase [Burkholderia ubonensis]|uniref:Glutamyl-tRNA amidotransferase n=2 Tax=Burkholderia ubonensis TaxID=101571 RepID=A0A1R1J9L3_9BURK|nr:glutamyl-tRNA amidotransferase [Burkholderia ubonensis]